MGIKLDHLNNTFVKFIQKQPLFFVATADVDGRVNLSPKGLDSLRIVNNKELHWLSVSGSGNETAAHVQATGRMTLMFCAFEGDAMILRVYGQASVTHPGDQQWEALYEQFPDYAGARNIFSLQIDLVTTSCGTGIPEMRVMRERADTELLPWFVDLGQDGVEKFWRKKNVTSLDGKSTGLFKEER
ncbi:MAG: pyridoxamine 5'-phosphate oxidase family protein [Gammaproteobacteria bacterium]|nr:pyridoxamine 5'-phosphate oxidase family protein [Gammaproteobacteria bacterium]